MELQKKFPDISPKDVEEALRQTLIMYGERTTEQGFELETGCVIADKEEYDEVPPGAGRVIRDIVQFHVRIIESEWRPPQAPSIL